MHSKRPLNEATPLRRRDRAFAQSNALAMDTETSPPDQNMDSCNTCSLQISTTIGLSCATAGAIAGGGLGLAAAGPIGLFGGAACIPAFFCGKFITKDCDGEPQWVLDAKRPNCRQRF